MEAPRRIQPPPSFYDCVPTLVERREQLLVEGYTFVSNRKPRMNAECPCKSKRKIKNCCASNLARAAGATWLKPLASAENRRML